MTFPRCRLCEPAFRCYDEADVPCKCPEDNEDTRYCPLCNGHGVIPDFDDNGEERGERSCPECMGCGEVDA